MIEDEKETCTICGNDAEKKIICTPCGEEEEQCDCIEEKG